MTTTSGERATPARVRLRQRTAKVARWLHIYLSMVSFAIVLFFAVTGLTVNHPDWFAHAVTTRQSHGQIDPALLNSPAVGDPQRSPLIERVRAAQHLHGAVDEVRSDDSGVSFSFRAPGYSADVSIDRPAGTYTVTEVRNGFVAVINDLHKGRDAGKVWSLLIDASAVLLTLVSLTGLVILWFVYKRRSSGLVMALVGLGICVLVYKVFVP